MCTKNRVVVTGLGAVSALGIDETAFWDSLISGKTGIKDITTFDVSDYKTKFAAEVDREKVKEALTANDLPISDPAGNMMMLTSFQALTQAGLMSDEPKKIAAIIGTGQGPSVTLENAMLKYGEKGLKAVRPTTVPKCMPNSISGELSIRLKLCGENYMVVSACSSSTAAIGTAWRMIADGHADKVLCGGTEDMVSGFYFSAWENLRVMSRNSQAEIACRPFDADRDGMVLGAGAGALMLESEESATKRGAQIRAEVIGYGTSSDASHITKPSPEGQAAAINAALCSAEIAPDEVGFVNCHGTATKTNDPVECASIRMALGDEAADKAFVASNKSYFGHTIGAAGALETIATILGLEAGKVPPNLNLDNPDKECIMPLVGSEAMEISSTIAMKTSFAFGGNNAVLLLKRA